MLPPESRFVLRRPANESEVSLDLLFSGYPPLRDAASWIAFFCRVAHLYDAVGVVRGDPGSCAGLPPTQAALVFSMRPIGGIFAILILGPSDRSIWSKGDRADCRHRGRRDHLSRHTRPIACADHAVRYRRPWLAAAATHQSLNGIVGGFLSDDRSRQWRRLRHRHGPRRRHRGTDHRRAGLVRRQIAAERDCRYSSPRPTSSSPPFVSRWTACAAAGLMLEDTVLVTSAKQPA